MTMSDDGTVDVNYHLHEGTPITVVRLFNESGRYWYTRISFGRTFGVTLYIQDADMPRFRAALDAEAPVVEELS